MICRQDRELAQAPCFCAMRRTSTEKNARICEIQLVSPIQCVYNRTICIIYIKERGKTMGFIDVIKDKARADKKTIVLPESMDRRTWVAAEKILKEGLANLVIIGTPEDIGEHSKGLDVSGATIINPQTHEKTQEYIDLFVELRKAKGMTPEKAKETILSDYAYYGCLMIKSGDADGMVSGACHSTANTLRPCLQVIKTKPGTKLVSAFFLMEVPDCELGDNGTFVFADCGLNQNPNPEELAAIAVSSAESFNLLTGREPKVAMLSHSSKGSASHADVDKVVEATKLAKEMAPELQLDGELQLDAAIVPEIGESKAPGSPVAGHANVLVFPDLDAGNIGYKLVQRLGKAAAYGPMCQGIAKPVNDLSRGCSADDIVGVVAITAVQCQNN